MLRDFRPTDAAALAATATAAFDEYKDHYSDWPAMRLRVSRMADLAQSAEIIVAEIGGYVAGAVAYVGPSKPRTSLFEPSWSVMRMLVVRPDARGQGLGRSLTEACVRRAQRDGSPIIALHTTPIMAVALAMYTRMGFSRIRDAPDLFGVPYGVYAMAVPESLI